MCDPCPPQALVTDLGTAELARCGGREALLFRENTLATKAIDEYMKLVAQEYLQETLGKLREGLVPGVQEAPSDLSSGSECCLGGARILGGSGALLFPQDVRCFQNKLEIGLEGGCDVSGFLTLDCLLWTAGEVVRRLCASTEDCEVDPSKCPPPELSKHQARLRKSCEEVFETIIQSYK